jgi:hypothetical protein
VIIKRTGLMKKPLFYGMADATHITIEESDIAAEGQGIEIQVQGFEGDRNTDAENTTHVYVEKWNGETRILVWNNAQDPQVFTLVPAGIFTFDLGDDIEVEDDRTGEMMHGKVKGIYDDHYDVDYHGEVGEAWPYGGGWIDHEPGKDT